MVPASLSAADRFHELLNADRELGVSDCVTIPALLMQEFKSIDLLAHFKGWYETELGFKRVLKRSGYESLEDAIEDSMLRNEAMEVTGQTPQPFDLGWANYHVKQTYCVPVFFMDGMWCGVFHSADRARNLMTCFNEADRYWRVI